MMGGFACGSGLLLLVVTLLIFFVLTWSALTGTSDDRKAGSLSVSVAGRGAYMHLSPGTP